MSDELREDPMLPDDRGPMERGGQMDHAAAHERIGDLVLEPAALATLPSSTAPEDVALRHHLADCQACAAELESWRRLQVAVGSAVPADPMLAAAAVRPIDPPSSLRSRVLAAVRHEREAAGQPVSVEYRPRGRRLAPWLALAASVVVVVGAVAVTLGEAGRRATAQAQAQELAAALAIVDRMLGSEHKVVRLQTAEGAPGGTISWSRHDWVVLTTALAEPPQGQEYRCWLESEGRTWPVGHMEFAGNTAYWVASLDEWQTWEIGPTTRFVVSLERAGSQSRTGPPVLEATLGS